MAAVSTRVISVLEVRSRQETDRLDAMSSEGSGIAMHCLLLVLGSLHFICKPLFTLYAFLSDLL